MNQCVPTCSHKDWSISADSLLCFTGSALVLVTTVVRYKKLKFRENFCIVYGVTAVLDILVRVQLSMAQPESDIPQEKQNQKIKQLTSKDCWTQATASGSTSSESQSDSTGKELNTSIDIKRENESPSDTESPVKKPRLSQDSGSSDSALGIKQNAAQDETFGMEIGENILQLGEDAANENFNKAINGNHFGNVAMDSAQNISTEELEKAKSTQQLLPHAAFSQIDLDKFRGVKLNMDGITEKIIGEYNSKVVQYTPGSEVIGEIFQQKGYYCESQAEHKPFSKWGFHHTRTIYHYIIFYYRINDDEQPEMFAMTTGQAWQVIKKFADFNFPSKIAKRILSKEGMCKRIEMPLFGNKRKIQVDFEDPQRPDPLEPLYIPYSISRLREDASILKLQKAFSTSLLPFVTVGNLVIRFKQRFGVENIEDIVDHLSKVSKRKDTYTFQDGEETDEIEKDCPEAQSNNLAKVEKSVKFELDKGLQKLVLDWLVEGELMSKWIVKENGKTDFDNFYLSYKHFEDFNTGRNFELRWKTKNETTIKRWDTRPKLMSVIDEIRDSVQYKKFRESGKHFDKFPTWFSKLRFTFTNDQGQETPNQKLLQFIQGDMLKDGRIYWHLNNQWFQVMDDYLALVNSEFKKLLQRYLISKNSNEYLKIKYPNTKTTEKGASKRDFEGKYNKMYEGEANFIVGDNYHQSIKGSSKKRSSEKRSLLVQNIEMFDLLFYDEEKGRTFLYHVKEGFAQKTRDVASQIKNSAELISGLLNSGDTNELDEFYKKIIRKYEKKLPKICENVNTFKEALKKAYFVYAFADTRKEEISFLHESTKKDAIDSVDLENKLSELGDETRERLQKGLGCAWVQVTGAIISKLKASGYAEPQSEKITAKLIYGTAKDFTDGTLDWLKGDTGMSETTKISVLRQVFKKLSQLYCTGYDSTLAKFELLRIPPKLVKHGFKFKICEIEVTGK